MSKAAPLYGSTPRHARIAKDRKFTYTPGIGYVGPDRLLLSATSVSAQTSDFEVMIGVAYGNDHIAETPQRQHRSCIGGLQRTLRRHELRAQGVARR